MRSVEKSLKTWLNNSLNKSSEELKNQVLEKTEFVIHDGLFEHHKCFAYIDMDGCLYYLEYFGTGWHKRRPNKEGWCKYLGYMAYNIRTGEIKPRREIF